MTHVWAGDVRAPDRSGLWARSLNLAEDRALALLFAATITLPLAEMVGRALLGAGIEGVVALVQHLTLALGMFGAAVARDGRLLTLAVSGFLQGRAAIAGRFAGSIVAAAATLLLLSCTIEFVAVERASGATLVYGLPKWLLELPLPLGYALIAWRLVRRAAFNGNLPPP
jgi:TRAP-type C4-dicarboxylate transport system permease small subunit